MKRPNIRPSPLTVMGVYSNLLVLGELEPQFDPLQAGALLAISFGPDREPTPEQMSAADRAASQFLGMDVASEKLGDRWLVWPVQPNTTSVQ